MMVGEATASHDVWIAAIAAVPATIIALATWNNSKKGRAASTAAKDAAEQTGAENTEQHGKTAAELKRLSGETARIGRRQDWVIDQIGAVRQALLDHVEWEQSDTGKYSMLERTLARLEAEVAAGRSDAEADPQGGEDEQSEHA